MASSQLVRLSIVTATGMTTTGILAIDPDTLSEQVDTIGSQIVDMLSTLLHTGGGDSA